jgi:hypothetical protein
LDLSSFLHIEPVPPSKEVENKLSGVVLRVSCEKQASPEEFIWIGCDNLDGVRGINSDFVEVGDVLTFLEVLVSAGLAILGKCEQVIGLYQSIANLYGILVDWNFGVFPQAEQF